MSREENSPSLGQLSSPSTSSLMTVSYPHPGQLLPLELLLVYPVHLLPTVLPFLNSRTPAPLDAAMGLSQRLHFPASLVANMLEESWLCSEIWPFCSSLFHNTKMSEKGSAVPAAIWGHEMMLEIATTCQEDRAERQGAQVLQDSLEALP